VQVDDLLATMWRIRLFEERVAQLVREGEIEGLVHSSMGQEGVAAAVCLQLRDDDAVYSGHRAHGHALAKGASLERTMAELMGRDGGLCRGSAARCTSSTSSTASWEQRASSAGTSRWHSPRARGTATW
jgi:TPP-dependent pyruvate/acetoin dehydrogenase alpha subunit